MKNHGFTFVEIIIAIGLAAIMLPALARALSFSIRVASQGEKFSQANALGREYMEAVYYIKSNDPANWAWSTTSPASGMYQPTKSGSAWSLGSVITSPIVNATPFTRTVQVSSVNRDVNGNIAGSGTNDPSTRFIHVVVSWPEANGPQQIILDSYVTNH